MWKVCKKLTFLASKWNLSYIFNPRTQKVKRNEKITEVVVTTGYHTGVGLHRLAQIGVWIQQHTPWCSTWDTSLLSSYFLKFTNRKKTPIELMFKQHAHCFTQQPKEPPQQKPLWIYTVTLSHISHAFLKIKVRIRIKMHFSFTG